MSGSPWENIPLAAEEPARFRQSLLTTADACPYAAGLYTQGMVPGHPLYRGSVLHEVFDKVVKTLTEHGHTRMAPDDVKAILEEVVRSHPDWAVPAKEWDGMRVMCQHFADHFELPAGALSEVPYVIEIAGKECTGTIDLLWVQGETLHIRDFKTGFHLYKQEDVSGKDASTGLPRGVKAAQLIQYAVGAADGKCEGFTLPRGVNLFDLAFVFPTFATVDGMAERGVVMTRPELIEHRTWLEALVERTQHAFREQRFTAVPGSHCTTRCPNSAACPIPLTAKGTGPFERPAREAAEEWHRLDAEVSRLLKELKSFAREYGDIDFGSDLTLGFTQVETNRQSKRVKEALMQGEIIPPDKLYEKSVSTRFGLRKR